MRTFNVTNIYEESRSLLILENEKSPKRYQYKSNTSGVKYYNQEYFNLNRESKYYYKGELMGTIPHELYFLIDVFRKSEEILQIVNDEDEEQFVYDIETWKSAIKFLIDYGITLLRDFDILIDKPYIYNGPRGSIDILWEYDSYTFLVNIHSNNLDATFYADNTINTQRVRGEFQLGNYTKTLIPLALQF